MVAGIAACSFVNNVVDKLVRPLDVAVVSKNKSYYKLRGECCLIL